MQERRLTAGCPPHTAGRHPTGEPMLGLYFWNERLPRLSSDSATWHGQSTGGDGLGSRSSCWRYTWAHELRWDAVRALRGPMRFLEMEQSSEMQLLGEYFGFEFTTGDTLDLTLHPGSTL
jgi:hypothetical protein